MTMPVIDGFTSRRLTLADEWLEPLEFEHPSLVPLNAMSAVERFPTGWLVIEQYTREGHNSDGVSTVLITPEARDAAFEHHSWAPDMLGDFGIVNEDQVELGLSDSMGDGSAEFFCQVQLNHGLRPPTVEISQPFLWYWDAIRDGNDWFYLDGAGREQPLIRSSISDGQYKVEVRALEFRRYLGQRGVIGLNQHDHVLWADVPAFSFTQYDHRSDWCTFTWHASHERYLPGHSALSRLLGKNFISGISGRPVPSWLDYGEREYPEFIIGVDDETGEILKFTCNPDEVSNYFGKNPDAPHYLTPVHFDARVLDRYIDEPDRYSVSTTRLAGLDMWSISIGRTSSGDVDVYLGDLGRDMPWQELDHWRAHNVPPRGKMNKDRFRRDFLGQFAGEQEPLDALRDAYGDVNRAFQERFGWPLFRTVDAADKVSFERLHPPVLADRRALVAPVLVLTKTLVDAIDAKALKAELRAAEQPSISLLEALISRVGGDPAVAKPLRSLYRLRSSGGIAHSAGESKQKILASLGIADLSPGDATNKLAADLAASLRAIAEQVATGAGNDTSE